MFDMGELVTDIQSSVSLDSIVSVVISSVVICLVRFVVRDVNLSV